MATTATTTTTRTRASTGITATPTARLFKPQTTPFTPPTECANQFITSTSFSDRYYTDLHSRSDYTWSLLTSGAEDPRFSACQPSGWDDGEPLHFSPAVCPAGWGAWYIRPSTIGSTTITTAICCSGSYSPADTGTSRLGICRRVMTDDSSSMGTQLEHAPWRISWAAEDVPTLSPKPPVFKCSTSMLYSWIPKEGVNDRAALKECQNESSRSDGPQLGVTSLVVIIVLPIVFVAFVCMTTCCYRSGKKRRRRDREALEAAEPPLTPEAPPLPPPLTPREDATVVHELAGVTKAPDKPAVESRSPESTPLPGQPT